MTCPTNSPHRPSATWAETATLLLEQAVLGQAFVAAAALIPWICRPDNRFGQGFHHYLGRLPRPVVAPDATTRTRSRNVSTTLWLHAVSLGEGLAASALIPALVRLCPDSRVCVTTTHPDSLATLRRRPGVSETAYFPLDLLPAQLRAWHRWRPTAVLLTETDFWPGLCWLARHHSVPLILVNGRISTKIHGFYRRWPALARLVFGSFRLFLAQTETDRTRLLDLGAAPDRVVVTGNLKADVTPVSAPQARAAVQQWCGHDPLWILGSLHPSEFAPLLPLLPGLLERHPRLRLLIAPRAIANVNTWSEQLHTAGIANCRRTALTDRRQTQPGAGGQRKIAADADAPDSPAHPIQSPRVCLLDTLGELADLYGLGTMAFVGGSLDTNVGGHNPLEPLHHQTPLLMGPHCRNFAALVDELRSAGGIRLVADADELTAAVSAWIDNPATANAAAAAGSQVHARHRGALAKTVTALRPILRPGF